MIVIVILSLITFVVGLKNSTPHELIESDVRLMPIQRERIYKNNKLRGLGTVDDGETVGFWRNHYVNGAYEIPVVFDEDDEYEGNNTMSTSVAASVLNKMRSMETKLGGIIRFVTEFNKNDYLDGYIRIGSYTSGCWSYVGRLPVIYQPQVINFGTGCDFTDTVEHELMHALGFFHEQARPDRDDYVIIHWTNIPPEKYANFEVADGIDSRGSPYDKRSIMHYDNYAFAINNQFPSMSSRDQNEPILGSSFTMTYDDIIQLRMLYRCTTGTRPSYSTNCDTSCPCRLDEGVCTGDTGCIGTLVCVDSKCAMPGTTTSPSTSPTTAGPTVPPTPTANPTPQPTTQTTTNAPTYATSINDNTMLAIGLGVGAVLLAIIAGSLFIN